VARGLVRDIDDARARHGAKARNRIEWFHLAEKLQEFSTDDERKNPHHCDDGRIHLLSPECDRGRSHSGKTHYLHRLLVGKDRDEQEKSAG
jgi:hypothetical protein